MDSIPSFFDLNIFSFRVVRFAMVQNHTRIYFDKLIDN